MSVNDASGIVIDNSRVMLQIVASLTDNFIGIIYNHNMFIVQATAYFPETKKQKFYKIDTWLDPSELPEL
jgi:hypothetical protein